MGVKLEDLLKENKGPLLEDKSKKTINRLLIIISLIIMLILVLVVVAVNNSAKEAQIERAKRLSTDIDLISTYIQNVYAEYRETGNDEKIIGLSQEDRYVTPVVLNVNGHNEEYKYGYYYVTAEQIKSMISTLNIENEDYVLNYSTGDAVNLVGVKWNGKTYYSVDDLRAIRDGSTPPSDYTIYINTPEDMQYLHQYPNGYFKLGQDIDMTSYANGDGWLPVPEFSGKFEGRGYVIKNLNISRASQRYCGLFGQVKNGATINNLKLENVNISGGEYTGAIAGACSGNVYNCVVTGTVSSQASNVGGIFGLFENGVVRNVTSKLSVDGSENVGGFVGSIASGTIEISSHSGKVTGFENVGGFAGRVSPLGDTLVSQVYTDASVIANRNAGGALGAVEMQNASKLRILDTYAHGKITSCSSVAGGFVGNIVTNPGSQFEFDSVYTVVDTPILTETRGGFAGNVSVSGSNIVSRSFWERDNLLDKDLVSTGKTNNQGIEFEYHTPADMRDTAIFEGWNVNIWKFEKGQLPVLRSLK